MPKAAVVVDGLVKTFPGVGAGRRSAAIQAVDNVSFVVDRGGAFAIVGETGSGKTTVARCLVGLEVPTRGTIEVCGERWTNGKGSLSARRRRASKIQLVFQDPYQSLDPRQKVGQGLEEALRVHGTIDAHDCEGHVANLLERVGLSTDVAGSYPRVLSGGQRQRIAIARALAADPEVIVFDEAVSALDVSIQAQILNLISDLRVSMGLTTIFISHDLAVVSQVSQTVIVMRHGVVVEHGSTQAVLNAPADPYTIKLISSVPRIGWKLGEVLQTASGDAERQAR